MFRMIVPPVVLMSMVGVPGLSGVPCMVLMVCVPGLSGDPPVVLMVLVPLMVGRVIAMGGVRRGRSVIVPMGRGSILVKGAHSAPRMGRFLRSRYEGRPVHRTHPFLLEGHTTGRTSITGHTFLPS
ncbi:hypothetical protein [Spirochaeta thermophila]|uniref:hypothetical protein n=1 Tax=Winmispira thermophila TaxID=154 RepID=UPI00031F99DC|nr:hypothetical protein [Spirochaeta thermophila]